MGESLSPAPPAAGAVLAAPGLRRNALANLAGRVVSAAVWIALTPWALARLGEERFGVWALLFALSGYVGLLDL